MRRDEIDGALVALSSSLAVIARGCVGVSLPLVRMGSYTIEPSGQLRRHAVSHEEELRQLDVAPR